MQYTSGPERCIIVLADENNISTIEATTLPVGIDV